MKTQYTLSSAFCGVVLAIVTANIYPASAQGVSQPPIQTDSSSSLSLRENGAYQDGRKHGRWTGATADGTYRYEEEYEAGTLRHGQAFRQSQPPIRYKRLKTCPTFKKKLVYFHEYISRRAKFPDEARRETTRRVVHVDFTVNPDGSVSDVVATISPYPSMSAEAIRLIQETSGLWKPGTLRGEAVPVTISKAVTFPYKS